MASDELLTREEILTGLLARRARTLLFLIESRTAYLMAQSRRTMERFLTEEAARERDLAFLEAFSLGRQPPLRPTIQDLEQYASQWGALLPETPRMRAALAQSLGQKYTFTREAVPNIRAVLGLDEPTVQESYQRLYGQPLTTIFSPSVTPMERLHRVSSALAVWLESLPPFWTAFALTLTETVGAGILALPIATAGVGPLPGVVLLIVFGLINILTIACMAEAVSRSGTIRYGSAFIGRVVRDYLGNIGSLILSLGVLGICFLALWAYYIGFSTTMEDVTRIPAEIWVALLFFVGLYFLWRESLNATVASALLVGAVNISLILTLSLLAFTRVRLENLSIVNVPLIGGRPFDPGILKLIFGVVLTAYFGHLSVSNCAKAVIHRDPSGRSLIWGSMAAQVVVMLIYSIWVLAVGGALDPQSLASESGTALIPLAKEVGFTVKVLGSIFVILGMGMASIHFSLGLFNLTRERLPTRSRPVLTLPRRRGRVVLYERGKRRYGLRIALTYLGLKDDVPHFRLDVQADGQTRRAEIAISDHWELTALRDQIPNLLQNDGHLALEVVQADRKSVCLQIDSSLSVAYEGEWETIGLSMADLLTLPDVQRKLIAWLMQQRRAGLTDVAAYLEQDEESVRDILRMMVDEGLVEEVESNGETHYQVLFGLRRGREASQEIWQALDESGESVAVGQATSQAGMPAMARRVWESVLSERGRFFLAVSPIVIVFLLTEWLLFTDAGSFSGVVSFLGIIVVSLLAGIFPVLLLISSRRKGEFVPGVVYRFLGHPVLLGGIYVLSLSSLFLHGLVIWEDPVQRAGALFVGVMMLAVTISMKRRGAFARRMAVELREDLREGRKAVFAVMAAGQPAEATVRLDYSDSERQIQAATGEVPNFSSLRHAAFHLPAGRAQELKVWAHKVTAEGDSENLPGRLDVHTGEETRQFELGLSDEQIVLPLTDAGCQVDITLAESNQVPIGQTS